MSYISYGGVALIILDISCYKKRENFWKGDSYVTCGNGCRSKNVSQAGSIHFHVFSLQRVDGP